MSGLSHIICYSVNFLLIGLLVWLLVRKKKFKNKENEELFRILLKNVPLPIFYKSSDGKYLGCNEEFEKFIGRTESEIVGKTVYNLSPEEIADKYFEKDKQLFESGESQIYEWKAVDKEGSEHSVVFHKAALKDLLGNVTGLIGVIVDVTVVKEYEKKLQLKQMELERSNNDLEQFAHTVSHDLQEPLRMVSSFTDLLLKKHSDKLNEEAKSYINFAIDGAKRMQSQIQGLLTYSRVSTRSNPFDRISLNEVLKEALMNLSVTVKESGARIESEDLPVVFGDRYQLVSVFQNLIGNAIKFGKAGVIPEINIFTRDTGASDEIEISVSDNGIGILEKDIDKIFLIFHRLHSQDKYPGTGIGLAVVKKIIAKHGGEIHVDSVMNKGSKFVFSLKKGQI